MENAVDRRVTLIKKIIDGEISYDDVQKEVERLEKKFGGDAFVPGLVHKRPKPWDKKYLESLQSKGIYGAASKEYILHLAEVTEEVKKNTRNRRMIITILAAAGVIVAGVVGIIIALKK